MDRVPYFPPPPNQDGVPPSLPPRPTSAAPPWLAGGQQQQQQHQYQHQQPVAQHYGYAGQSYHQQSQSPSGHGPVQYPQGATSSLPQTHYSHGQVSQGQPHSQYVQGPPAQAQPPSYHHPGQPVQGQPQSPYHQGPPALQTQLQYPHGQLPQGRPESHYPQAPPTPSYPTQTLPGPPGIAQPSLAVGYLPPPASGQHQSPVSPAAPASATFIAPPGPPRPHSSIYSSVTPAAHTVPVPSYTVPGASQPTTVPRTDYQAPRVNEQSSTLAWYHRGPSSYTPAPAPAPVVTPVPTPMPLSRPSHSHDVYQPTPLPAIIPVGPPPMSSPQQQTPATPQLYGPPPPIIYPTQETPPPPAPPAPTQGLSAGTANTGYFAAPPAPFGDPAAAVSTPEPSTPGIPTPASESTPAAGPPVAPPSSVLVPEPHAPSASSLGAITTAANLVGDAASTPNPPPVGGVDVQKIYAAYQPGPLDKAAKAKGDEPASVTHTHDQPLPFSNPTSVIAEEIQKTYTAYQPGSLDTSARVSEQEQPSISSSRDEEAALVIPPLFSRPSVPPKPDATLAVNQQTSMNPSLSLATPQTTHPEASVPASVPPLAPTIHRDPSQPPSHQQPERVQTVSPVSNLATRESRGGLYGYNPFATPAPQQSFSAPQPPPQTGTAAYRPFRPSVPETEAQTRSVQTPAQPAPNPLATVASQLSRMGIQDLPPTVPFATEDDEPALLPPVLTDDGPRSEIRYQCPESRTIDYPALWYQLAGVPDFLICTRCYEKHIARTALTPSFEKVEKPQGRCRFNVARITKLLMPAARRSNDVEAIREYMIKRLKIEDCKGPTGAKSEEGLKWFKPKGGIPAHFVACEACYEEVILATNFAGQFEPSAETQPPDVAWACDVSLPFISRSILKLSDRPGGWNQWVSAASERLALPACESGRVSSTSRRWFIPRREVTDLVFCEACYYDKSKLTIFENELVPYVRKKPGVGSLIFSAFAGNQEPAENELMYRCDMNVAPVLIAWDVALEQKDYNTFFMAATNIVRSPECPAEPIEGGTWYTLAGGCDNFDVCGQCYAGFVETLGLTRFFQPSPGSTTGKRCCDFNPRTARCLQYMYRFSEAIDVGVWSIFSLFVRKFSNIPLCPRRELRERGTWYGFFPEVLICPDCWETFAAHTKLAASVPMKAELREDRNMCSMYSVRMRTMWLEAGEKGDTTELIAFSRLRMETYVQTVAQIGYLRQMQQMQTMQAMHAGLMSTIYQGINSFSIVAGTTDGNLHGNSRLGWYETEAGATSAQFRNQMSSGMSSSNNVFMTIAQLEMQWLAVE